MSSFDKVQHENFPWTPGAPAHFSGKFLFVLQEQRHENSESVTKSKLLIFKLLHGFV